MYIRAAYTPLDKVVIELFSHAFGQRSDQRAFSGFYAQAYLLHKIINLVHCRTNLNFRVQQPGRSDHLFGENTFRLLKLIVTGSSADIYCLIGESFKLIKFQRAVVDRSRQPETVFNQIHLS